MSLVWGLSFVVATSALSATRTQLNRCSDAARELRSGPTFTWQNKDVAPSEVNAAAAHLRDVVQRFEHAKKLLDDTGEWNGNDPELKDCVTQFQRYIDYFEATKKKLASAAAAAKQDAPVADAAEGKETHDAVAVFAAVQLEPTANVFGNRQPAQARALYDSLDPVLAACKQAHPEGVEAVPAMPKSSNGSVLRIAGVQLSNTLSSDAPWQCFVAFHREALARRAIGNVRATVPGYGNYTLILEEIHQKGARWNGAEGNWVFDLASDPAPFLGKLHTAQSSWYQAFGFAAPEGAPEGLAARLTALKQEVAAAAERNHVEPGSEHDRAIEGSARAQVDELYPKLKVVSAWMDAAGWTVEQNALGVPIDRFRSGQIVYRVGSDPWCRQRTFNWVEKHMGGGSYASPGKATLLEGVKVVNCP